VRCQTSDYKEHSTICAFFGGVNFSPQTLLAVLRTLTDEQILTRIPPADTYDDLDNDVKEKCEHYSFRSFWKQRAKAFNLWAYNRVRPSREKMFEFWWSLCRATEALIVSDELPAGELSVTTPHPMKIDFVATLLERKNIQAMKITQSGNRMSNSDSLEIITELRGSKSDRTYWADSVEGTTFASFYSSRVTPDVMKQVDRYLKCALILGFKPEAQRGMLEKYAARFPILNLD
jgi:hypothetical protein